MAIPEAVTVFDVMACLPAPIAHFAVVVAPGVYGSVADCNLGLAASLALEVRGLVHVAVNAATNVGYGVSSGEVVRTLIHS